MITRVERVQTSVAKDSAVCGGEASALSGLSIEEDVERRCYTVGTETNVLVIAS